jgi:hypothetical protein
MPPFVWRPWVRRQTVLATFLYGIHRHNTLALGSNFTALFTVTTVVFFFPLRNVIHRHITAAGLRYRYPRKPWLNRNTDIHASSGIRTHDPSVRASEDSSCLRPHGHCDRHMKTYFTENCRMMFRLSATQCRRLGYDYSETKRISRWSWKLSAVEWWIYFTKTSLHKHQK